MNAARPAKPERAQIAAVALACLDLTSLNEADDEAHIARLCARAQTRHGPVAAVCVWPRLAAFARSHLPPHIRVAAVANFPEGADDVDRALADAETIARAGAQEIDLVMPYRAFLDGDDRAVQRMVDATRRAHPDLLLKVILETGALGDAHHIARASALCLDAGADFIKTSTGKAAVNATPAAARTMLDAIARHPAAARRAGFKAAGGIRTLDEAATYLQLTADALGADAVRPQRLRLGASALLEAIEAELDAARSPGPHPPQGATD